MSAQHEVFKLKVLARNTARRAKDYPHTMGMISWALARKCVKTFERHEETLMNYVGVQD